MNVVNNQKTLARLWAAVYCDFESLLAKYMGLKQWNYEHFANVCRESEITLIMHITQGRGKTKDDHYYRIVDIIFQLCKELWLRSKDPVVGKANADKALEMKRRLGGFFLLYTMYEKQPIRDKVKIAVDINDLKAMRKFSEDVNELPFRSEVNFMIAYLTFKEAFHYCIYSEDYQFDGPTRHFLNHSKSEVVKLVKGMRDVQDAVAYSSVHFQVENAFAELALSKNDLAKDISKSEDSRDSPQFKLFAKTLRSDHLPKALDKIDELIDKPVVTLQALTATEAIGRRMMAETRRRMERAQKKAKQGSREGENKTVNAYVREGGIFGRKKETEEGEDRCKRRERGACNGNLWIYINGYDFDQPIGGPTQTEPATTTMKDVKEES